MFPELTILRLTSIMLGRFRMSVQECLEQYKEMGETVFGHPRLISRGGIPRETFDGKGLKGCIQNLTNNRIPHGCMLDEFGNFPSPEDLARTFVLLVPLIITKR